MLLDGKMKIVHLISVMIFQATFNHHIPHSQDEVHSFIYVLVEISSQFHVHEAERKRL